MSESAAIFTFGVSGYVRMRGITLEFTGPNYALPRLASRKAVTAPVQRVETHHGLARVANLSNKLKA